MTNSTDAAGWLFEIMNLESDVNKGKIELTAGQPGDVRLEKVTFKYPGRTKTLREVSLNIPAGKITAVIGESGSRKSTFSLATKLVSVGFMEDLLWQDADVRISFVRAVSLRRHVAAVSQKMNLPAGAITENIATGGVSAKLAKS